MNGDSLDSQSVSPLLLMVAASGLLSTLFMLSPALAGDMEKDPNGFYGIPWGTTLAGQQNLTQVESGEHIQAYESLQRSAKLGDAEVDSLRLVAIDGQFARVTVHYHGEQTHRQMLAYLQSQFGPTDRIPGSMMRGLNQQFNWRGPNTEVNLTYEANHERGTVFIESRTLAPRFNDVLPEHAY
jgi:hypothetical protein